MFFPRILELQEQGIDWPARVAIKVKEEKAQFSLLHKTIIMHEAY